MEKLGMSFGIIALAVIVSVIMAWPVQLLWNSCLVPAVDGIHQIGFWQALGINVLFSILFKPTSAAKNKEE